MLKIQNYLREEVLKDSCIYVENYLEAVGLIQAMKEGIEKEYFFRPIRATKLLKVIMINEIGWLGNIFFALGAIYLANKKTIGWYYNVLGNACYVTQGILAGFDSLWAISVFLLTINLWGIYNWKKENK